MEKSAKTHWLQSPNKNYLGHWDLPNGEDMIVTIKSAKWEEVKNPIINTSEAKRVVRFEEKDIKPFICNQTNAQSILKSIGIKFMEDSVGSKIQLFVGLHKDNRTKEDIDCIRVRNIAPKKKPVLNPKSPNWETAKQRVKEGMTMAEICKHYIISDKDFDLLCS